mgnify:CR=1 FL=1
MEKGKRCSICDQVNHLDQTICCYCKNDSGFENVKEFEYFDAQERDAFFEELKKDVGVASSVVPKQLYKTSSWVADFLKFIGFILILSGIVLSLTKFGIVLGIPVAISGLFLIVSAQMLSATVDTANNTREILEYLKNQDTKKD